jgi:hypothetical protein
LYDLVLLVQRLRDQRVCEEGLLHDERRQRGARWSCLPNHQVEQLASEMGSLAKLTETSNFAKVSNFPNHQVELASEKSSLTETSNFAQVSI